MSKQATSIVNSLLIKYIEGVESRKDLDLNTAAKGLTACYRNANSLLEDARILATHGRYARANTLTVIALEELGKIPDLFDVATNPQNHKHNWREFWKRFISHKPKQAKIINYGKGTSILPQIPYSDFLPTNLEEKLNVFKQRTLYVDFVDNVFRLPEHDSASLEKILDFLFAIAEERADSFASMHATVRLSEHFLLLMKQVNVRFQQDPDPSSLVEYALETEASIPPLETHDGQELAAQIQSSLIGCSSGSLDKARLYEELRIRFGSMPSELLLEAVESLLWLFDERVKARNLPTSACRASIMREFLRGYIQQ